MNTTNTTANEMQALTAAEREQVLTAFNRLPYAERTELLVTRQAGAWMDEMAKHLVAWRGRE